MCIRDRYGMVLVYGMADSCLYNKQNNTWTLGDMEFISSCSHSISHSFAALTRSISMWTLEHKFHISARPCIIPCVLKLPIPVVVVALDWTGFYLGKVQLTPVFQFSLPLMFLRRRCKEAWILSYSCTENYGCNSCPRALENRKL